MKKTLIITICLLLLPGSAIFAQNNKEAKDSIKKVHVEELKKLRRELFIKKLELTEKEAEGFFPIFDEYQSKLREAKKAFRTKWNDKKPEELTEAESSLFLADAIALREKEVELYKNYSEKLKTVIPVKKVVLLFRVEKEVKHELIDKAREWKKNRPKSKQTPNAKKGDIRPMPPHRPDEE